MLRETFFNSHTGWGCTPNPYMTNSIVEFVMRSCCHKLSPSYQLINDYQSKKITWKEFSIRYIGEMNNEICIKEMKRIKNISKIKDIYIVCSCSNDLHYCHRFILLDLINKIEV
jgi:uncharacterized protein YeaO (DUF488 family)